MTGQCKINIKPTITIGRVATIAETIIPQLFDDSSVVLESESIVHDKKKFFKIRLDLVKFLTPIVENIIHSNKETTLGLQLLSSGKLKIYQLANPDVAMPEDDESGL